MNKCAMAIISAIGLLLISPGMAASFDCSKASNPYEKAVCANSNLSSLDDQLAVVYKNARAKSADPEALRKTQIDWIKATRQCASDTSCIEKAYKDRIVALGGSAQPQQPVQAVTQSPSPGSMPAPQNPVDEQARQQQERYLANVKARQDQERANANAKTEKAKTYPYIATLTCHPVNPVVIQACFTKDGVNTELEITNGGKYKMYQVFNLTDAGTLTNDGLVIDLTSSFKIKAQNAASNILLNLTIKERLTGKVIFEKSVARFGVIAVHN